MRTERCRHFDELFACADRKRSHAAPITHSPSTDSRTRMPRSASLELVRQRLDHGKRPFLERASIAGLKRRLKWIARQRPRSTTSSRPSSPKNHVFFVTKLGVFRLRFWGLRHGITLASSGQGRAL